MHVVIWTAAGNYYATSTSHVVEIIPAVQVRPVPGAERWIKGLMNYRGSLVPLVDMQLLLGHDATEVRMASRVLVIGEPSTAGSGEARVVAGMLVESVIASEQLEFAAPSTYTGSPTPETAFLGPVALTPTGTVQLTQPDRIPLPAT